MNFWRVGAVQLTVVCVPNSGYVSDPPVSDSHPDDHAARHALSRALRCDRCVSLSLVVPEARRTLRCDRHISLSSAVSETRRCLPRARSVHYHCCRASTVSEVRRCLSWISSVSLSLRLAKRLSLLFRSGGWSSYAPSRFHINCSWRYTRDNIVLLPASVNLESCTTLRYRWQRRRIETN